MAGTVDGSPVEAITAIVAAGIGKEDFQDRDYFSARKGGRINPAMDRVLRVRCPTSRSGAGGEAYIILRFLPENFKLFQAIRTPAGGGNGGIWGGGPHASTITNSICGEEEKK